MLNKQFGMQYQHVTKPRTEAALSVLLNLPHSLTHV